MSPRAFSILLIATLICVVGAIWAIGGRETAVATTAIDEPLFAGLGSKMDLIGRIEVDTGGETTTAVLADGGWQIEEKNGYAARPNELRDLVLGLASTKLVEAKTADPGRYSRLDLEDPGTEGSASQGVTISDTDGNEIASLIIGKKKFGLFGDGRAGSYVRRGGEAESWLADRSFDLPAQPLDWLERAIIDLPRDDVREVILALDPDNSVLIRATDNEEEFELDGVPEGKAADFDKLRRTAGTLSSLNLTDVRPVGDMVFGDDAPIARYTTTAGLIVAVTVMIEGDGEAAQAWIKLEASQGEPVEAVADDGSGDGVANDASEQAPVAEQVVELNKKLRPWTYAIPNYLAERLVYRLDDLLAEQDNETPS